MADQSLNLARKWRTKTFDQIAGQDLSVRILKNSLYVGHFFPVYLFSGQHGCGKTSTARIFACAINCQALEKFQQDPKAHTIPCLTCSSCRAMLTGKHLDFIEIDAASHTGVDNIRAIIDTASLLPLNSRKKIYLIDEVHMLSKAAFNALLKILEEPPATVLFILATTDPQKILETVKSRCFQLFFKAVETSVLVDYLQMVCKAENISYEVPGLEQIVNETRGSVRDALNIIEQVRFATGSVTQKSVLTVLGHLDMARIVRILTLIIERNAQELLNFMQEIKMQHFSAELIWHRFIELIRAFLLLKHGARIAHEYGEYMDQLQVLASSCSTQRAHRMLTMLYDRELVFLKTTKQHLFLEMLFLQLCELDGSSDTPMVDALSKVVKKSKGNNESSGSSSASAVGSVITRGHDGATGSDGQEHDDGENNNDEQTRPVGQLAGQSDMQPLSGPTYAAEQYGVPKASVQEVSGQPDYTYLWKRFLQEVESMNDPLVLSIFSHGRCVKFDQSTGVLDVELPKNFSFFESVLHEQQALWSLQLKKIFSHDVVLNLIFVHAQPDKGGAPYMNAVSSVNGSMSDVGVLPISAGASPGSVGKAQQSAGAAAGKSSVQALGGSPQRAQSGSKSVAGTAVVGAVQQASQKKVYNRAVDNKELKFDKTIDISDKDRWKMTHMVLSYFPGSIYQMENENE